MENSNPGCILYIWHPQQLCWIASCLQSKSFSRKTADETGRVSEGSNFVTALETLPLPEALAFAVTASYKINDLKAAEGYITEAEKKDTGSVTRLRIAGYKALVYLREGRENGRWSNTRKQEQDFTADITRV